MKKGLVGLCGMGSQLVFRVPLCIALTGCGAGRESTAIGETVAEVAEAVVAPVEIVDSTGTVAIRIKTCDPSPAAFFNCAYCVVDNGWARIGGGGQILGEPTQAALIHGSFPSALTFPTTNSQGCSGPAAQNASDDKAAWVVRASGTTHQLQAYIIEMQFRTGPGGTASPPITTQGVDRVTNSVSTPGQFEVDTPESDLPPYILGGNVLLVGGGANVFSGEDETYSIQPQGYLTASYPVDGNNGRAWRARGLEPGFSNEQMKSFAIGVERCPAALAPYCLSYPYIKQAIGAATLGYGKATETDAGGNIGILTSIGAEAPTTTGTGRYLADLIPFNGSSPGFTVRTAQYSSNNDSAQTFGFAMKLGSSVSSYNLIRFFQTGSALAHGTGTNPRLVLTTSIGSTPSQWYVELLSQGVFRIRYGNPGSTQTAECAFRDGTTTDVRIKACGTGNEFKWKVFSGNVSSLQLLNVSANKCLDSSGQVTGNLVLNTCNGSTAQTMFQDGFNWPPTP